MVGKREARDLEKSLGEAAERVDSMGTLYSSPHPSAGLWATGCWWACQESQIWRLGCGVTSTFPVLVGALIHAGSLKSPKSCKVPERGHSVPELAPDTPGR